ncbi:MAG TPA: NADH-quinone oxidoreductase subunit N [Candidatus Thalassarchaeaceae archaeon]|jgi:NADH-quinone oxidoreductase subunit N|nr:NADH-quinone oxidoreductase subunit N [Candidatus Thalassarchaeaceae archaeon]
MSALTLISDPQTATVLLPEFTLIVGIVLLILVPNLGKGTFRLPIPNTNIRLPYLFGGERFAFTSSPRIPGVISVFTLLFSTALALWSQMENPLSESNIWCIATTGEAFSSCAGMIEPSLLKIDGFSRLLEIVFYGALMLCGVAMWSRMPATPRFMIHAQVLAGRREDERIGKLLDNRRQVDFHLLLLMVALGMSVVALANDLFVLFIGLELASLSSYVLVAFMKETDEAPEAGMKYFIVGSVASAIGLYGISLLYLWNGNLQIPDLAANWQAMDGIDPLALAGLGFIIVTIGFKVSSAPFHLAAPDAYSGAASPVAGLLATASKAMGFVVLLRVLVAITMPESGEAFWVPIIGLLAAVTMTWGNFGALSSENPKRMLAYSSVAHAGYLLAAVAALGINASREGDHVVAELIVAAMLFHLTVLVLFKLGSFLVLSMLESEGRGSRLEDLYGLAKREPLIATALFIFMLSLAGVPPLSGFLSKLLLVSGIIDATVHNTMSFDEGVVAAIRSLHWVFFLALLVFLNSALSLFYYLRVGWVMFFEEPATKKRLVYAPFLRITIMLCMVGTLAFGIGPLADHLLTLVSNAATTFFG